MFSVQEENGWVPRFSRSRPEGLRTECVVSRIPFVFIVWIRTNRTYFVPVKDNITNVCVAEQRDSGVANHVVAAN
eukprot:2892-Heterococcus_DN1.PRE.2